MAILVIFIRSWERLLNLILFYDDDRLLMKIILDHSIFVYSLLSYRIMFLTEIFEI